MQVEVAAHVAGETLGEVSEQTLLEAAVVLHPQRRGAVLDGERLDPGHVLERPDVDALQAGRQRQASDLLAVAEGTLTNGLHAVAQVECYQLAIIAESVIGNSLDTARNGYRGQRRAVLKRPLADCRQTLMDSQVVQFWHVVEQILGQGAHGTSDGHVLEVGGTRKIAVAEERPITLNVAPDGDCGERHAAAQACAVCLVALDVQWCVGIVGEGECRDGGALVQRPDRDPLERRGQLQAGERLQVEGVVAIDELISLRDVECSEVLSAIAEDVIAARLVQPHHLVALAVDGDCCGQGERIALDGRRTEAFHPADHGDGQIAVVLEPVVGPALVTVVIVGGCPRAVEHGVVVAQRHVTVDGNLGGIDADCHDGGQHCEK